LSSRSVFLGTFHAWRLFDLRRFANARKRRDQVAKCQDEGDEEHRPVDNR